MSAEGSYDASLAVEPCGACGEAAGGRLWRVFDHEYDRDHIATYRECASCGALSQTPMPSLDQLASFYPPGYHSFSPSDLLMKARVALRVSRLKKVLGNTPGAILDYGCGGGAFLLEAARQMPDRQLYGYEIDAASSRKALMDGRVKIYLGDPQAMFDEIPPIAVACLNHVIEHLPSPADIVTKIAGKLAPGGAIDGQTPQADSLERAVFKELWAGFHAPRHTVVFSRDGLRRLFVRCGLADVDISTAFNPGGVAVSLGSALQGARKGSIKRSGLGWLFLVGAATALAPIDLLSGKPGIMDFAARKGSP